MYCGDRYRRWTGISVHPLLKHLRLFLFFGFTLRFLPPLKYNGGEWNSINGTKSTEFFYLSSLTAGDQQDTGVSRIPVVKEDDVQLLIIWSLSNLKFQISSAFLNTAMTLHFTDNCPAVVFLSGDSKILIVSPTKIHLLKGRLIWLLWVWEPQKKMSKYRALIISPFCLWCTVQCKLVNRSYCNYLFHLQMPLLKTGNLLALLS